MKPKDSKKEYFDSFIKEIKRMKNDDDVTLYDFIIFLNMQSINVLVSLAEILLKEGNSEINSVHILSLSLFSKLSTANTNFLFHLLKQKGYEEDCSTCPIKETCKEVNESMKFTEMENKDDKSNNFQDFMNMLENDSKKWN